MNSFSLVLYDYRSVYDILFMNLLQLSRGLFVRCGVCLREGMYMWTQGQLDTGACGLGIRAGVLGTEWIYIYAAYVPAAALVFADILGWLVPASS